MLCMYKVPWFLYVQVESQLLPIVKESQIGLAEVLSPRVDNNELAKSV